jgi:FkbM family methyltransferase
VLLKPFIHEGKVRVDYEFLGRPLTAFVRVDDTSSDFGILYEQAVCNAYRLDLDLRPELIIDGGGNVGMFTLSAIALNPDARIIVCEPVPRNITQMREHFAINGVRAEILQVCIGGSRRKLRFYEREAGQGSTDPAKSFTNTFEVEVVTLDDVISGYDGKAERILVKLDIEGMEIEALQEFVRPTKHKITIVGELHDHKDNKDEVVRIFTEARWTCRFYDETDPGSNFYARSF